jgi:hypothetical protein
MLAVGGVHLQYCHNPKNQSAALRITRLAKQRVLHLVNLTLRDTDGRDRVVDQSETELVMAALLSCTIASVSGDGAYRVHPLKPHRHRASRPTTRGTNSSPPC